MLSKKALSVAVAAVLTQGAANAAVDFQGDKGDLEILSPGSGKGSVVASEALWGESNFVFENKATTGSQPLYFTSDILRTVAEGTNKYVRIDLTNAAFKSTPELTFASLVEEGTVNTARNPSDLKAEIDAYLLDPNNVPQPESTVFFLDPDGKYVIFEISAKNVSPSSTVNEDIPRWLSFTIENEEYTVGTSQECVSARYRLYNNPAIAQNAPDDAVEKLLDLNVSDALCFAEATREQFATVNNAYTGLQSEFTKFINSGSEYYDTDEDSYYDSRMNQDPDNNSGPDGVGNWKGAAVTAETAAIGFVDASEILMPVAPGEAAKINPNGNVYSVVDIVASGNPTITLNSTNAAGFAFGEWSLAKITPATVGGQPVSLTPAQKLAACDFGNNPDADITAVEELAFDPLLSDNDTLVFPVTEQELEQNIFTACVDVSDMAESDTNDNLIVGDENPWQTGDVWNRILESSYSVTLNWSLPVGADLTTGDGWEESYGSQPSLIDDNGDGVLKQDLGSIIYDTMSVDVPFLSSFDNYNQRFHLTNYGPTPAKYKFVFTSEEGVTVAAGAEAEGTIPANGHIVVQSANIASFTDTVANRKRTAASLQIGAEKQDIAVAVAIINRDKGTIDIQNLTTERDTNELPDANLQN